jgi:hypothetical protein
MTSLETCLEVHGKADDNVNNNILSLYEGASSIRNPIARCALRKEPVEDAVELYC